MRFALVLLVALVPFGFLPAGAENLDEGRLRLLKGNYAEAQALYEKAAKEPRDVTVINYAFAYISGDGSIVLDDPGKDTAMLARLAALRNGNPRLRLMISVGGWTRSSRFSPSSKHTSSIPGSTAATTGSFANATDRMSIARNGP